VPDHAIDAAKKFRYARPSSRAALARNLARDEERKQTLDEAMRTHDSVLVSIRARL